MRSATSSHFLYSPALFSRLPLSCHHRYADTALGATGVTSFYWVLHTLLHGSDRQTRVKHVKSAGLDDLQAVPPWLDVQSKLDDVALQQ